MRMRVPHRYKRAYGRGLRLDVVLILAGARTSGYRVKLSPQISQHTTSWWRAKREKKEIELTLPSRIALDTRSHENLALGVTLRSVSRRYNNARGNRRASSTLTSFAVALNLRIM
jgi:hypothetical protein